MILLLVAGSGSLPIKNLLRVIPHSSARFALKFLQIYLIHMVLLRNFLHRFELLRRENPTQLAILFLHSEIRF